jgi:hypothetical protein
MTTVQLISCDYLKQNTSIENAVDDALLTPIIEMSQMTHIQTALGTTFYNEIQTQIADNTLTVVNEALVRDYIQPALSKWTEYESVPLLTFSMTNKSLLVRKDDNSDRSSLEELKYFRNSIRDNAEWLLKRLNRELTVNLTLYPTYATSNGLDNVPKKRRSFFNGVYISRPYDSDCTLGEDKPHN